MRKVTVSFSDEEGRRIRTEATNRGISVSKLLRERLEKFVKNNKSLHS